MPRETVGFNWRSPVIGLAATQGAYTVELLEENDEGQLVLEGESAQGDDEIGTPADFLAVAVGAANENGDAFDAIHLPGGDFFRQFRGGGKRAALVEDDPQVAPGTGLEKTSGVLRLSGLFEGDDLDAAMTREPLLILGHAGAGVIEGGFADDVEDPFHEWRGACVARGAMAV